MTHILLPVFIAIVGILGLVVLVPIVIRELFQPRWRTRQIDQWLDDLNESRWEQ